MTIQKNDPNIQKFILLRLKKAIEHHQAGDLSQAEDIYREILQKEPQQPDALHLLGLVLHQKGDHLAAIELISRAIKSKPNDPVLYSNLGSTLHGLGRFKEAVACYQKSLSLQPNYADTYINLGNSLKELSLFGEAASCYRRATILNPDNAQAYTILGNMLQMLGHYDEGISCHQRALALKPDYDLAYSNMLLNMMYLDSVSPEALFKAHRQFAEQFEVSLIKLWKPHPNHKDPDKKLKVGYVSGDFHNHALSFFIAPILACHDKSQIEVYCYYNNLKHDAQTDRMIDLADHWLVCAGISDDELAERIRQDGIDILVDLSGHTGLNRLLVFARKPAPVQATWMGYPGTTGLDSIDYRITDHYLDPLGMTECFHSEKLIRLPDIAAAYEPTPGCPPVNRLPALDADLVTFACLNYPVKFNPTLIQTWSRILSSLPQSRMIIGNMTDQLLQNNMLNLFDKFGIQRDRLVLLPRLSLEEYFELHHQIDIALDTFPYNGGTTTIHSLWMGIPVLTLAGCIPSSRQGLSLLARVGLNDFITNSADAYVAKAIDVASDLPLLSQIRLGLRARVNNGNYDPATITRHLESAYRQIWRDWCQSSDG